jgi:hypothetical protein
MRPIVTFNRVTADGYFADRDGSLEVHDDGDRSGGRPLFAGLPRSVHLLEAKAYATGNVMLGYEPQHAIPTPA